jgi:hypothetical protein
MCPMDYAPIDLKIIWYRMADPISLTQDFRCDKQKGISQSE